MSQKLIEAFEKLKALDAVVPDCDGAVILNMYSDGSYGFVLELWGGLVADARADGSFTVRTPREPEPWRDYSDDVDALIEKLNNVYHHD